MDPEDIRTARPIDPCDGDEPDAPAYPTAVTTQEELEAFYTVRTILRTIINCQRIVMRDCDDECSVLLDNDPEKTLCTFKFAGTTRTVLFHEEGGVAAIGINSVNDLYDHAMRLRLLVAWLERTHPHRKRVLEREILA
jgi:predicted type IV restriction endonuclease